MSIGKTIKDLRHQKGISQVDLASRIGVSKQTLYKYENEIISNIPSDKIESLAAKLGTTPSRLMGWDAYEDSQIAQRDMIIDSIHDLLNKNNGELICENYDDEQFLVRANGSSFLLNLHDLMQGYKMCCEDAASDQNRYKKLLQWIENHNSAKTLPENAFSFAPGKYQIPIVATVAAGEPIYSEENIEGWIDYDKDPRGHVFACRIKGNSMSPRIQDGDIIIVDQESDWEDGDIVLVTVNGNEGTCKRIQKYADSISLISLNPTYDPMVFTTEQVKDLPVEIKGKVVEARARF